MSELEEKLGTILSNPQLMQQISAMAQALGQAPPEPPAPPPVAPQSPALPDPAMLQKVSGCCRLRWSARAIMWKFWATAAARSPSLA